MKKLTIIMMVLFAWNVEAGMKFEVKGPKELKGTFAKYKMVKKGNTLKGFISLLSINVKKEDDKKELLEYFDARKHPSTIFKAKVIGGLIEGTYSLKGKTRKLTGVINGKEAKFQIPLTDLVTGFKAMFLDDKDVVEIKVDLK